MADRDYLVTARKYRPSLFKEVVAQEHVTDTLKNAIRLDRVAHAYLFSGPRGVGKTTAARILAKAINCETPREEREDEAEPCCECESCRTFEEGGSLNVFELDAASNRKVGDVEPLLEKVTIPPQGGRKKVYIIDEVHMFSKHAFNALLKTLEEPPDHALFIFATTEPNKVIPTVRSRCQRFDFRRIPVPKVVDHLRSICEAEGIEADEESLILLARKGNGALRDALSAFDQAISLCGTTLEYGDLTEAMGVVDQDLYFDLTGHVATQDTAGVLTLVRHVVRSGYDLQEFLAGVAEHLRNLLVVHSLGGDALEGVAESTRSQYVEEAERFGEADLLRLLTVAGEAEDDVKNSPQPRLKLETTLLKMAQMRRAADLKEVLQKIDRLEQMVEAGEIPESLGDASSPTAPENGSGSAEQEAETATSDAAEPTPSYDPDPPEGPDDSATPSSEAADSTSTTDERKTAPDDTDADDDQPPPSPERDEDAGDDSSVEYDDLFGTPALGDDASAGGNGPADTSGDASANGSSTDARGSQSASGGAGGSPQAAVAEPAVETAAPSAGELARQWPQLVQAVKGDRISLGSLLGEAEPTELRNEVLTVTVPKPLHRDTLRDQRRLLLKHLAATFEVTIEDVEFVVEEPPPEDESTEATDEPASPREQLQALRDTYPALDVLFEEFGAEPVW